MRGAFRLEDETKELEEKGFCNRPLNSHSACGITKCNSWAEKHKLNGTTEELRNGLTVVPFFVPDCCCVGFFPNHRSFTTKKKIEQKLNKKNKPKKNKVFSFNLRQYYKVRSSRKVYIQRYPSREEKQENNIFVLKENQKQIQLEPNQITLLQNLFLQVYYSNYYWNTQKFSRPLNK